MMMMRTKATKKQRMNCNILIINIYKQDDDELINEMKSKEKYYDYIVNDYDMRETAAGVRKRQHA
jgi:hypothetical protein